MAILGGFAAVVISAILRGFALQVLWGWFVVEWFGLKALSIPEALGLSLVVGFLTLQYQKDERSFGEKMIYAIVVSVIVLAIGWLYHKLTI